MKILGVDFTSAPSRRKAITATICRLSGNLLEVQELRRLTTFQELEQLLETKGPWIGGFDFPFGLPREAVVALKWPEKWDLLVEHCRQIGKPSFTAASDALRKSRPIGMKYPKRKGDNAAKSHSPMKCVNPPVGWMFVEGAPRLLSSKVTIPGLQAGDPTRIAVEAYPGFVAKTILARQSYKHDLRVKQTPVRLRARTTLIDELGQPTNFLGIQLRSTTAHRDQMLTDGSGDYLDATICAMQAAWSWQRQSANYGLPLDMDAVEGWIATVPAS